MLDKVHFTACVAQCISYAHLVVRVLSCLSIGQRYLSIFQIPFHIFHSRIRGYTLAGVNGGSI